jgi:Fe-S cluster assembly iron-binding protein IscA
LLFAFCETIDGQLTSITGHTKLFNGTLILIQRKTHKPRGEALMEIVMKPSAVAELKKYDYKENEGVRIEAIYVGSCSIYAEHNLKIDIKRADDDLFDIEGIPVLVSKESQKHLYHRIVLDFNPALGYKLSSDEEVYRYNLKLLKR